MRLISTMASSTSGSGERVERTTSDADRREEGFDMATSTVPTVEPVYRQSVHFGWVSARQRRPGGSVLPRAGSGERVDERRHAEAHEPCVVIDRAQRGDHQADP